MCYWESWYVKLYSLVASIVPQAFNHQANVRMRLRRLQLTGWSQLFVRRLAKTVDN